MSIRIIRHHHEEKASARYGAGRLLSEEEESDIGLLLFQGTPPTESSRHSPSCLTRVSGTAWL
ncbi:hypothetical protein SAY86_003490 [Trapa natans]|uniref:Uncharacterized protein n=1 Tax=Trapa natans TaxID=22666 RepID=A0AAN7RPB3_TRANT|nr:hypothetical protein SAY86_003490 [Trapa natans]